MTNTRESISIMTLDEINDVFSKRFAVQPACRQTMKKKRISVLKRASDVLFYLAIFIILYSIVSVDMSEGRVLNVMGYGAFTVMSSSMKDEIPKGSVIITKQTQPQDLQIGDNITYMRDTGITITHKIVEIYDDAKIGEFRFQTKGTNNTSLDDYIVSQEDVLGKVILSIPEAGAILIAVSGNVHIILALYVFVSLLSYLLCNIPVKKKKK